MSKIAKDNIGVYSKERAKRIYEKDEKSIGALNWVRLNDYVVDYFSKNQCENVLDLGCGTGRFFSSFRCENLFGVDLSADMLAWAKETDNKLKEKDIRQYKNLLLLEMDIVEFCKQDQHQYKFDFIFSAHTLYTKMTSLDICEVIKSISAVVRPGAKIVLDINFSLGSGHRAGFDGVAFLKARKVLEAVLNFKNIQILQNEEALAQNTPKVAGCSPYPTHVTVICDVC